MAKKIKAVRYLGSYPPVSLSLSPLVCPWVDVECSAKHNRGVLEAFTEASRVSLTAKAVGGDPRIEERKKARSCVIS